MREIVLVIKCHKCEGTVVEIVNGKDGDLEMGIDPRAAVPFVIRLAANGSAYRFFCKKCGMPTTWDAGPREFREFKENLSIESVITAEGVPGQWQFARITMPVTDQEPLISRPDSKISECASVFASNISRVNEIAEAILLSIGLNSSALATNLHLQHLFILERHTFARELGDDAESKYMKEFINAVQMLDKLKQPLPVDLLEKMRANGELILDSWANRHSSLTLGIRAVLLAQLSLAWTAFEILSSDLWVAAVNERPNPLAVNFAKTPPQGKRKSQPKSIAITNLSRYANRDFNLSKVMGNLFVSEKKADFTSLRTTRFAYDKAFGTSTRVLANPDLRLLELVRNLVLHRAGIVDDTFLKGIGKRFRNDPDCAQAENGKPFPIDAKVVNRMATAAATVGAGLLEFVANQLWPVNPHLKNFEEGTLRQD